MDRTDKIIDLMADLQSLADQCRRMAREHVNFEFSSSAKDFADRCDAHLAFCRSAAENAKAGDLTEAIRLLLKEEFNVGATPARKDTESQFAESVESGAGQTAHSLV